MKTIKIILSAIVVLAFTACSKDRIKGSGVIITEGRNITGFTKISSSGSTDVEVARGTDFKIEVTGYSNLLPYYETKLQAGTLVLGYRNNVSVKNDNVKVKVTLPLLNGLSLSGSGNISTAGFFNGHVNFEASVAGSGNIFIAQGISENYYSSISGSGNIYAFGMHTQNAETHTSGSGNHEINVITKLKVHIAGSGNVYYKGTPVITAQINGSGAVIQK